MSVLTLMPAERTKRPDPSSADHSAGDARLAYRADIDGMRAIAVLGVVLFHAKLQFLQGGFVGVDVFFVISGFLIGGTIYREAIKGHFSFARFYAHRARRIAPALIAVSMAVLAGGALILGASEARDASLSTLSALLGVSNIRFWSVNDYFSQDAQYNPMLMTWSLGIEEQFYLLFPFVIIAALKLKRIPVLGVLLAITAISFALNLVLTENSPNAAFYLLPPRAWELSIGATLAVWQANGNGRLPGKLRTPLSILGMAAILLPMFLYTEAMAFPGWLVAAPVLGATLVIMTQGGLANRWLSTRLPVAIGKFSYSWYLWHWPLIALVYLCSARAPSQEAILGAVLLSVVFGFLSWRYIETPFRVRRFEDAKTVKRYAAGIAAVVAVSLGLHQISDSPLRLSDHVRRIDADATADKGYPCLVNASAATPSTLPLCNETKVTGPNIAIFGDSHAAALGRTGTALASDRGWGTTVLTKQNCRPLTGVSVYRQREPELTRKCSAFLEAATKRLTSDTSIERVILAGLWSSPLQESSPTRYVSTSDATKGLSGISLLEAGLTTLTRQLSQAGKTTILVQDVPSLSLDPVRATLIEAIAARKIIAEVIGGNLEKPGFDSEARQDFALKATFDKLARTPNTSTVDAAAPFCSREGCRFEENGQLLFHDQNHITRYGAKRVFDHARREIWK